MLHPRLWMDIFDYILFVNILSNLNNNYSNLSHTLLLNVQGRLYLRRFLKSFYRKCCWGFVLRGMQTFAYFPLCTMQKYVRLPRGLNPIVA